MNLTWLPNAQIIHIIHLGYLEFANGISLIMHTTWLLQYFQLIFFKCSLTEIDFLMEKIFLEKHKYTPQNV